MSSDSYNKYGNKGYEGIDAIRQAARDADRKQREEIRELLLSNPDTTNKEFINSLKKARIMTGSVGLSGIPTTHEIESFKDYTKASTITPDELRQAKIDARNEPYSEMDEEEINHLYEVLNNTSTNRGSTESRKRKLSGGKRKSRKSKKSRKSRRSRRSRRTKR